MTLQEHIAYIEHAQEETRAFVSEQHKLAAEPQNSATPCSPPAGSSPLAARCGAALFGGGMVFAKLIGV
jgi:hypothetical protein